MQSRISECSARTAIDIEVYAEKAAYEGQVLRSLLNSLQTKTNCRLSAETRIYAETVYEQRLFFYVEQALRELIETENGWMKAKEIVEKYRRDGKDGMKTLNDLFKPILTTSLNRLSKLSDLWKKRRHNKQLIDLIISFVESLINKNVNESILKMISDIIKWPPLVKTDVNKVLEKSSTKFTLNDISKIDDSLRNKKKVFFHVRNVDHDDFLKRIVHACKNRGSVHVLVDNEEEVRFMNQFLERMTDERITIGTMEQLMERRFCDRINNSIMCDQLVISRGESIIHNSNSRDVTVLSSILPIDDLLIELHNLITITFNHICELEEVLIMYVKEKKEIHPSLISEVINQWPNHLQIIEFEVVIACLKKSAKVVHSEKFLINQNCWNDFTHCLRRFISNNFLNWFKKNKSLVEDVFHGYINNHCEEIVYSALRARELNIGDDYTVHFDTNKRDLSLIVQLSSNTEDSLGLKQFLELRHGCSLSPYRIPVITQSIIQFIQSYPNVYGLVRSNYFNRMTEYHVKNLNCDFVQLSYSAEKPIIYRPYSIDIWVKNICEKLKNIYHSYIVVCSSAEVLRRTFNELSPSLKYPFSICETMIALDEECNKNGDNHHIVLTTRSAFKTWNRLPSSLHNSTIIVGTPNKDESSKAYAYSFAVSNTVISPIEISDNRNTGLVSDQLKKSSKLVNHVSRDSYEWCVEWMRYAAIDCPIEIKGIVYEAAVLDFALWIDIKYQERKDWDKFCRFHFGNWSGLNIWPNWFIDSIFSRKVAGMLLKLSVYGNFSSGIQKTAMSRRLVENKKDTESLYYACIVNTIYDSNENTVENLLYVKGVFNERMRRWTKSVRLMNASREPIGIGLEKVYDSPRDVRCDGFIQDIMKKIRGVQLVLNSMDILMEDISLLMPIIERKRIDQSKLLSIARRHAIHYDELENIVDRWKGGTIYNLFNYLPRSCSASDEWKFMEDCRVLQTMSCYALSAECVSNAAHILPFLKLINAPDEFQRSLLYCGDRHLDDCSFYSSNIDGINNHVLTLEGSSREYCTNELRDLMYHMRNSLDADLHSDLLKVFEVLERSMNKKTPLYLLPRRPIEILMSDLINSGLIISPSSVIVDNSHMNNDEDGFIILGNGSLAERFQLNHINSCQDEYLPVHVILSLHTSNTVRSVWRCSDLMVYAPIYDSTLTPFNYRSDSFSRLLSIESSLLDYGTHEWMQWLTNRSLYSDISPKVVNFYRKTLAERDACSNDDRLIQRISLALRNPHLPYVQNANDEIKLDEFVKNTVEVLNRGERLIKIEPPLSSYKMADRLGEFIRSRRIPPSYNKV